MKCYVCGSSDIKTLYKSDEDVNVTSSCQIVKHEINIYFCGKCTHVQASPIKNIESFYKDLYVINQKTEPEDQLLSVKDGERIFKSDYEADIFLKKNQNCKAARILDYGAAKGLTLSKICNKINASPFVFDVTDAYQHYWSKFFPKGHFSAFEIPEGWYNSFDVVTSFFVLEHVIDAPDLVSDIFKLLKEDGLFYFQIPNFQDNLIDLMVSDHVHHYTQESIFVLLEKSGFEVVEIDTSTQPGTFIVKAIKKQSLRLESSFPTSEKAHRVKSFAEMGVATIKNAIVKAKNSIKSEKKQFGIMGAGFYGTYLYQQLEKNSVGFFVDNNPYINENCALPCYTPDKIPEKHKAHSLILAVNPLNKDKVLSSIKPDILSSHEIIEVFSQ